MLKLSGDTLNWTKNFACLLGDTDLMPVPFEFDAIADQWDSVRAFLGNSDMTNWNVRAYRRTLAPKNRFGFRSVTQLDPYDFLVYSGLVFDIGPDIESVRLAPGDEIALSHRFSPESDGRLFDSAFDWPRFERVSKLRCKEPGVTHVVRADIADFFPRVYSHRVEGALDDLKVKPLHAASLKRFLNQLNQSISYGIPTGPLASFLLSELLLNIIDRGLLSEGALHCRWSDDFRIFCSGERDAYRKLNVLARLLFENYGLTLQQNKTRIDTAEAFLIDSNREENREIDRLSSEFDGLLAELGIETSFYESISLEDLDPEQRERLRTLNLLEILHEQIDTGDGFSQPIVRFVMWRLRQLGDPGAIEQLLERLDYLYPVVVDVLRYIYTTEITNSELRRRVVTAIVNLLDNSLVSDTEFTRGWLLAILAKPGMLSDEAALVRLFNRFPDQYAQRQVITALGRAHAQAWLRARKHEVQTFSPWLRRAFLAAASALPGDEAEHYYRSIKGRLDHLDQTVCDWAVQHRF
jgi:hypothetical protein